MSTRTEISPGTQRLLEGALSRRPERLLAREQLADGAFAAVFLVAAVLFAWLAPAERHLSPGLAAALVAAYVLVGRAEFASGAGFAVPTQVVLVPMLLLLPTPTVPLLVALALVLTTLADALRGRTARDRVILSVADAWFALAPAVVLVAAGAQTPDWGDWPFYVLALVAQVVLGTAVAVARVWTCLGESPRVVLAEMRMTNRVDVLLAPVGLLAAFAAVDQPYAALARRAARRALLDLRAASAPLASSRRSSSRAPTAARPCCWATSSRPTTPTRASTPRTWSSSP